VCTFRVAAVPRRAEVRAGAFVLLQRSAAGRRERPPLRRGQELPAVAIVRQHRQAGAQGRSEPKPVRNYRQELFLLDRLT